MPKGCPKFERMRFLAKNDLLWNPAWLLCRECSYRKTWTADLLVLLGGSMHAADLTFCARIFAEQKANVVFPMKPKTATENNMSQKWCQKDVRNLACCKSDAKRMSGNYKNDISCQKWSCEIQRTYYVWGALLPSEVDPRGRGGRAPMQTPRKMASNTKHLTKTRTLVFVAKCRRNGLPKGTHNLLFVVPPPSPHSSPPPSFVIYVASVWYKFGSILKQPLWWFCKGQYNKKAPTRGNKQLANAHLDEQLAHFTIYKTTTTQQTNKTRASPPPCWKCTERLATLWRNGGRSL